MASSWVTYTPPTREVKSFELDSSPPANTSILTPPVGNSSATYRDRPDLMDTSPSELVKLNEKPAALPFTSTSGFLTEVNGKGAPTVVSTTSIRVTDGLRTGVHSPTTRRSAGAVKATRGRATSTGPLPTKRNPQRTSAVPQATHSSSLTFNVDSSAQHTSTPRYTDTAAAHLIGPTLPIHNQVIASQPSPSSPRMGERVVTNSRSNLMLERRVLASAPNTNSPALASRPPISAASDASPPLPADSTYPRPMSTTGIISTTGSPSVGASQRTPVNLTLSSNPDLVRDKAERQGPKRSVTGGTAGSGSIVQSQYTDMVFEDVPRLHNIFSCFCTWVLLAGFVVLPGTFSTLEGIGNSSGEVGKILHSIRNLPLMVIAFACCAVGGIGMCLLWWRWSHNYVWLLNSIFIPGTLNGLSGVISTFAGIYGSQNGVYGASSIATLAVTGGCTVACGFLTVIYSFWKLNPVKRRHMNEMAQVRNNGSGIGERHYLW